MSLPPATQGVGYSATLAAGGGVTPYTWSLTSGSLPAGLSLDPSTGAITGTPTTLGTSNFTVRVTDSNSVSTSKDFSLSVNPAPLTITTASPLPEGTIATAYLTTLVAGGGIPPYTWSLSSGTLPAGLALNVSTGAISGTPTTLGTATITARVTDSTSGTSDKVLSITISPPVLRVTTTSPLPAATAGVSYDTILAASGGATPYTWAVASGSLPGGLALDAQTGAISGRPTAGGTSVFAVDVTDALSAHASQTFSLSVAAPSCANGGCLCPAMDSWAHSRLPSPQTGTFQVGFDATPGLSSTDDIVLGLSNGEAQAFANVAVITRFSNTGIIDAINGSGYQHTNNVSYSAGTSYHFRVRVNLAAHVADYYVTPAGQTEILIGSGYAFRSEQATVTQLDTFNMLDAQTSNSTTCAILIL